MMIIPNIPLKRNLLNEYFFNPRIFNPANKLNNGIKKERLDFQGFGEEKPITTNKTNNGRAQNRRTEFVILGQ